jgi:hypothetical protein
VKADCAEVAGRAFAYFYFEFNDANKQSPYKCLSSLVSQLCSQTNSVPTELEDLYKNCQNGRRSTSVDDLILVISAFTALKTVSDICIVLDALDECPKTGPEDQRTELLMSIKAIHHILDSKIHLLVTSRQEIDIDEFITPHLTIPALSVQDAGVTDDIREYVSSQLGSDPKLNSWPDDIKSKIQSALVEGADGM